MQYNTVLTSEHLYAMEDRAAWETYMLKAVAKNFKLGENHLVIDHFTGCDGHPAAEALLRETLPNVGDGAILSIVLHWKILGPNYRSGDALLWDWRTVQRHILNTASDFELIDAFWRWPSEDILQNPALVERPNGHIYTAAHLALRRPKGA